MRLSELSIQQRINLWYLLAFLAVWVFITFQARQAVRRHLEGEIYRDLDRQWTLVENAVREAGSPALSLQNLEQLKFVELFQRNDARGRLYQSDGWRRFGLNRALQQGSYHPFGPWRFSAGWGSRLFYLKVMPAEGSLTSNAVAIDATRRIDVTLRLLTLASGFGLLATTLLVLPGGYWVTGAALKPIRALIVKAFQIDAKRISSRLPRVNPEDEIGKLTFALNLTLDRLKEDFEQIQRFSANASHELRTPLAVIRSLGEVALQTEGTVASYRETLGSMLEEVERLSRLVDGLLLLSRAESGQIPLRMHSVDLGELVQSVTGLLGILASEKKQELLLEIGESASVHIDPMLVSQAITNVLDNSIRYTPVNGTIRLRMGLLNKKAAFLDIIDSGPGIPPWARERVFEHFYRLPSKEKTPGTGLGLAIAHWVMKVNGGGIEFLEPEKPGAWCRITLPLATEPNPR